MKILKNNKAFILSILTLSLPAIIEMGLVTLVGIADTLMISRIIGKEGLSAAGFSNQIIFTLVFIFSSFNTGATAMVSRSYGEKNFHKLNTVVGQNLSLNIFIGFIITLLSVFFAREIFVVYDISPTVLDMSLTYFKIVSYSILFMFVSFCAAACLRGAGDTKTPMVITALTNILNVIGNFLLMKGPWIFPEMGIAGAALSTTLSRFIGMLIFLYVLVHGKNHLRIHFSHLKLDRQILGPLWKLSYPGAMEQFSMQVTFLLAGIIISQLDTNSEAAFRILLNIENVSFMPAVGISMATAALVGKSLGEKNPRKALEIGYTAAALGVAWGIFMGSIFILFPTFLLGLFTKESVIISASILAMTIAGFNQPFLNFMIVMSGALRGAGDTKAVMVISALRLWILFVPLAYLFILVLKLGVAGMWLSEILSFFVFSIILFRRFYQQKWAEIEL